MGLSFTLFSVIDHMTDPTTVIGVSLAIRFLQGLSSATIQTTCYCMATNEFPDKTHEIVGWVEACTGVGCIVGPILGSFLYNFFGFKNTFLVWGSFLIFMAVIVLINFDDGSAVNHYDDISSVNLSQSLIDHENNS